MTLNITENLYIYTQADACRKVHEFVGFFCEKAYAEYDSVIELKRQMNYNDYITFLSPLQGGKNEDAFET